MMVRFYESFGGKDMSRRVDFYTISLWSRDSVTNYPVSYLFECISEWMVNEDAKIVRKIGDKWIRVFPYYYSLNRHQMIIPFGKLKNKNKPYWLNPQNRLEEVPESLYDINSLGYDLDYNVMVFTTNREGPTYQNIEEYLNTFIPRHTGLTIKIDPIMYNTGIEKVRRASLVRSVTLNLDLGRSLNNFYLNQFAENIQRPLISAFKSIAEVAKNEADSKILSLTLGLGKHGKREDTLNIDSMLYLLESINIGEEFVTEIRVNYKDGSNDKIDVAKLKESQMLLFYQCQCKESQVSPESLLKNINDAVATKVLVITRHIREYFSCVRDYDGEEFNIVNDWDNNA